MNEPQLNTYQLAGAMGFGENYITPVKPPSLSVDLTKPHIPTGNFKNDLIDKYNLSTGNPIRDMKLGIDTSRPNVYERNKGWIDLITNLVTTGADIYTKVKQADQPIYYVNPQTNRQEEISPAQREYLRNMANQTSQSEFMNMISNIQNRPNNAGNDNNLPPPPKEKDNTLLYVAIGGGVLLLIGIGAMVMVSNNKK